MKTLTVLHAGCVKTPLKEAAKRFMSHYKDVSINMKGDHSVSCIRRLLAGEPCDVIVSADDQLLESMLLPKYIDGYRVFAGNSMSLMATQDELPVSTEAWLETLTNQRITFGHYDPATDPGGYRAVMACLLADHVQPGLSRKLLDHPGRIVLGPNQEKTPQFIFTYLSDAIKSGRSYALLPDEMSLSNEALNALYYTVTFNVGETVVHGADISHALAIPGTANNPKLAQQFVQEFLSIDLTPGGFTSKCRIFGKDPLATLSPRLPPHQVRV